MIHFAATIPTYNPESCKESEPRIPVCIHTDDGICINLGTDDPANRNGPNVQIERRKNGYVVFIRTVAGWDQTCYVYMLDDGRCFVLPENNTRGPGGNTQFIDRKEAVAIDALIDDGPALEVPQ